MRWRNEAEKKIVLEAAAEYGKRTLQIAEATAAAARADGYEGELQVEWQPEHFEQWLQWYLGEELHLQSVHAYMRATPATVYQTAAVPHYIEQLSQHFPPAEKQQTTPKKEHMSWSMLRQLARDNALTDKQVAAVEETAARNRWKLRDGEELDHMLSKITGGNLQIKLCAAAAEAG